MENLTALMARIVNTHHVYLRRKLPRLEEIMAKMTGNHGRERPELFTIQQLLQDLRDDLTAHLAKEEQILFPFVERLERSRESGGPAPAACFQSVQFPIRVMFAEHDRAETLLAELRSATGNYNPPKGACDCYARFFEGLANLETDLLEHIRVENQELFPRAVQLEEATAACR